MMCLEDGLSQVEESPQLVSNKVTGQFNLEDNLEQHLEQNDSAHRLEPIWSLQEWINYVLQLSMTEEQSHMNQECLDQSCTPEARCKDEINGTNQMFIKFNT